MSKKGGKSNSPAQLKANGGPAKGTDGKFVSDTKGGNLHGGDGKSASK